MSARSSRLRAAAVLGACIASAIAQALPDGSLVPGPEIPWYSIDSGGGTSTGGTVTLSGTIGQPDAVSALTGGTYRLMGGFWAGSFAPPCVQADFNCDGVVNGSDLSVILGAWGTAGADLNGDGITNGADLALVLQAWTG